MSQEEQKALLDHELEHFEVKRDKHGSFLYDDINRPLLSIRKHDRQHGSFDNIAKRHGTASGEVKQFLATIFDDSGQSYLPFAEAGLRNMHLLEDKQGV